MQFKCIYCAKKIDMGASVCPWCHAQDPFKTTPESTAKQKANAFDNIASVAIRVIAVAAAAWIAWGFFR